MEEVEIGTPSAPYSNLSFVVSVTMEMNSPGTLFHIKLMLSIGDYGPSEAEKKLDVSEINN
jgi:hypothetical protein